MPFLPNMPNMPFLPLFAESAESADFAACMLLKKTYGRYRRTKTLQV
jgi:hypothetical protein